MELRGAGAKVQLDRLKIELLGEDEKSGIFQLYEPPDEPFDDGETKALEKLLLELEFAILSFSDDIEGHVSLSANESELRSAFSHPSNQS